jgi:hypothetical protein
MLNKYSEPPIMIHKTKGEVMNHQEWISPSWVFLWEEVVGEYGPIPPWEQMSALSYLQPVITFTDLRI